MFLFLKYVTVFFMPLITNLIADLTAYQGKDSFNPWADYHPHFDIGPFAPAIRVSNLEAYLDMRQNAKYILIGEGLSYQGGHFSGMAMTSERQVMNDTEDFIFKGIKQRTSHPMSTDKRTVQTQGFTENTGSIVWKTLAPILKPTEWITWNIFPWHPHKPDHLLTNRLPREDEIAVGLALFQKHFNFLGKNRILIAVGKTSGRTLTDAGYSVLTIRHPANGGGTSV
ncbi:MAG: uracil-DNA glycosylase [Alphaproteobacteria bacterium]|nr:uracil-DNA glycosylase [Alphaproteobacteria bacterium]